MYKNVLEIQKRVTFNQVRAIFGVDTSSSIGKIAFPAIQAAPSFPSTFAECFNGKKLRCLIICAIDQDPYFRMTRDVAPRMNQHKPSLLHCKFLPGLHGVNTKMSASDLTSAIYLNDTPNEIQKKISKSKSGGAQTRYLQKKTGADLEQDVPLMYLRFFLDDDEELKRVEKAYSTGKMETGEVKEMLIKTLTPILLNLQKKKNAVTEELIKKLTTVRQLMD
ncbi:hypothetical protein MHBO_004148 [Bonamia ostreae]|uniref:tryptophan--tRNA ligase n=1 Tax=Bonamia ostreae TaxID=126728 RepID=A0ABV2ASI5_9EUKA